ncbi:MAG: response regulator transcription factor [Calditrichaeota bacterium]|nr:response regulator transcription factor [Calditrichota bacterium]
MKAMIIDDEPIAHQIVGTYCEDLSFISIEKNCYDALQAMNYLTDHQVDLIFLDIKMPKIAGFEFLQTLSNPPKIIVMSAYDEYAIESYEYDVSDYLLKPFSLSRFLRAIDKVRQQINDQQQKEAAQDAVPQEEKIFIKDEKKRHQVNLEDILYIEAAGNYAMIYLENSKILSQEKISDLEKRLENKRFVRIHRSYIVAVNKIQTISGNDCHLEKKILPIGRVYKANVNQLLNH